MIIIPATLSDNQYNITILEDSERIFISIPFTSFSKTLQKGPFHWELALKETPRLWKTSRDRKNTTKDKRFDMHLKNTLVVVMVFKASLKGKRFVENWGVSVSIKHKSVLQHQHYSVTVLQCYSVTAGPANAGLWECKVTLYWPPLKPTLFMLSVKLE